MHLVCIPFSSTRSNSTWPSIIINTSNRPRLEGEGSASRGLDGSRDRGRGQGSVVVAEVGRGDGALLSSVLTTTEVVVNGNGVTGVSAVEGLLGVDKDVALNQELSALAGVDTVADILHIKLDFLNTFDDRKGQRNIQNRGCLKCGRCQSGTRDHGSSGSKNDYRRK